MYSKKTALVTGFQAELDLKPLYYSLKWGFILFIARNPEKSADSKKLLIKVIYHWSYYFLM